MKQRALIAILTILVLGAGYLAGVWTERHSCKVPKPPKLPGELATATKANTASTSTVATPPNPAKLAAEIKRYEPQIERFRLRMLEIDREMDAEILGILRPEQAKVFEGIIKRFADIRAKEDEAIKAPTPLTAEEIMDLQQKPLYKMLGIVVVPLRLEWNTKDLNLDAAQQEKLREILKHRRDKFLELVDSSPPPSLTLSRLILAAPRLTPPKP